MADAKAPDHLPPLAYSALTPIYDLVVAFGTMEAAWRPKLVKALDPQRGERILDVGCGTGTTTVAIAKAAPDAEVVGFDPDAPALDIARRKASNAGAKITWVRGRGQIMPFPSERPFDKALSTLAFHHLTRSDKAVALAEIQRILKPGAPFFLVDFGRQRNWLERTGFWFTQVLDGFETTEPHAQGALPVLMREAQFADVREVLVVPAPGGAISIYRAEATGAA